jgi:site-specific recombinase XerD
MSIKRRNFMKLLDQVRDVLRKKHYSYKTEKSYIHWIKRYIYFNDMVHPKEMGEKEISRFISHLAINRNVAASTQNQALNAIVFLYKQVLHIELGDFGHMERARRPKRLPAVLSQKEVEQVLANITGKKGLMAKLLYGCGLRLVECLRLRVKDIDFDMNQVVVTGWEGRKRSSYNAAGIYLDAKLAEDFYIFFFAADRDQQKRKNIIYLRVLRGSAVRTNKFPKPFLDKSDLE